MNLFKTLSWFGNLYPVRQYIHRRAVDYFLSYHVADILSNASRNYSISNDVSIERLIYKPAFRGTMSGLFRANDFYPSPKDICVSISIALDLYCSKYDKDILIDLSLHISRSVRERLAADQMLKSILKDLGKEVKEICFTHDREEIQDCLSCKKELFVSYFETFSDPSFNHSIRIWHDSEDDDWIEWKEEDSIDINIDPLGIREGFFLVGFDYTMTKTGDCLNFATRSKGLEYFNDMSRSKNVIWAR